MALIAGCGNDPATAFPAGSISSSYTDADILNFALNLEYLEAEFYLRAATGLGLSAADAGSNAGTVTGGAKVTGLTPAQQNILNEIAYDEQSHVQFLRKALGSSAVSRPNIDLTFFGPLAVAAGITTAATGAGSFNPFTTAAPNAWDGFLVGAFVFEDVGVTAYNGAAGLITTAGITAGYLSAAAGIMAVEAYHAAYVRTYLTAQAYQLGTTAYPFFGFANKVVALRATLGGGNETALAGPVAAATTVPNATASTIVAADSSALAFHRTTDQVLHIVYGQANVPSPTGGTIAAGIAKGGFFPNGLNGTISVTNN